MEQLQVMRFQQSRQAQKISEEEKRHLGLLLFPDNNLSDLGTSLKNANAEKSSYSAVIEEYKKKNKYN